MNMEGVEKKMERVEKLLIIHQFKAQVRDFERRGILNVYTSELWDLVGRAQQIDWELKRQLHTLARRAMDNTVNFQSIKDALEELIEKYQKEEI